MYESVFLVFLLLLLLFLNSSLVPVFYWEGRSWGGETDQNEFGKNSSSINGNEKKIFLK